jgi:hypothetical protein
MRLNIPLVINEHDATNITVFVNETNSSSNPFASVQVSTCGPLVIRETGSENERHEITKNIAVGGNDAFHIQSPKDYRYPSGKEGDCLAQANILLRKLDRIQNQTVTLDSLSIDLYIKRKIINVLKTTWKSATGWATNLVGSAIITSLVTVATYLFGQSIASLVPHLAVLFVSMSLLISVLYSWWVRDKTIRVRLESNSMFKDLRGRT